MQRALHDDFADDTSAARDGDHLTEEVAIGVVDLFSSQPCRLDVCDQHGSHATS